MMIHKIATEHEVTYHACDFQNHDFNDLPWGNEMFDCFIFPPSQKNESQMEQLLHALPYGRIDWVLLAEPRSEFWHDRVDQMSVEKGIQSKVGDGKPMTAWFEELKRVEDWDTSYNHGACSNCLLVFFGKDSVSKDSLMTLRSKIGTG